jgi:hypothetical protein
LGATSFHEALNSAICVGSKMGMLLCPGFSLSVYR